MSKKDNSMPAGRILSTKKNLITISIISLVFGILLILWPQASLEIACKLIGFLILIIGAVLILQYFRKSAGFAAASLVGGILTVLIGLWLLIRPDVLIAVIPTIIGIVILLDGIFNLAETVQIGHSSGNWGLSLFLAVLTILAALLLIIKPLGIARFIVRMLGIVITYNGISDLLIALSLKSGAENVKTEE